MNLDDQRTYLPKYLSTESQDELLKNLHDFPKNIDQRMYTNSLLHKKTLFQGDALNSLPIINIKNLEKKEVLGLILSNTCDIDGDNKRPFKSCLIFAPIINISRYRSTLVESQMNEKRINNHIDAIKKQRITQIFYLPKYGEIINESIVFLDRVYNLPVDLIDNNNLLQNRIISLANYGFYLFLFKLSLHFTRIQEGVDRNY